MDDVEADAADDVEADEDDDQSEADDEDDESDDESDGDTEAEEDEDEDPPARARRAPGSARSRTRARGAGGMGRPSSGPAPRPTAPPEVVDVTGEEAIAETELAPDISSWPGTSEAAKIVGRHTSTLKMWRSQQRIRAIQDQAGCWRYHPEDLAEAAQAPDATDPGSVLAHGMTAIVAQGASANDRLLAMTELSVEGLKETIILLRTELKRVYDRNAELERSIADLRDKHVATYSEDLKHERYMRRLEMRHEVGLAGSKETSERIAGLLTIIGPIAAGIGSRLLGNLAAAEAADRSLVGSVAVPPPNGSGGASTSDSTPIASPPTEPASSQALAAQDDRLPLEARITEKVARLIAAIRNLDPAQLEGFKAMLPGYIAKAVSDIRLGDSDATVGQAIAVVIKAAQGLSDLQFIALRPIAPADVMKILSELRSLFKTTDDAPPS